MCVLTLKFLVCVSCFLLYCLLLWVNFVCVGCCLSPNMICFFMEFGHKLHCTRCLLGGGEFGAANMQHWHQSRWARESKSLDNHLLLHFHLIMINWMVNPFTFYLQWLGIGTNIWSLFCQCCYVILMVASVLTLIYLFWDNSVFNGWMLRVYVMYCVWLSVYALCFYINEIILLAKKKR